MDSGKQQIAAVPAKTSSLRHSHDLEQLLAAGALRRSIVASTSTDGRGTTAGGSRPHGSSASNMLTIYSGNSSPLSNLSGNGGTGGGARVHLAPLTGGSGLSSSWSGGLVAGPGSVGPRGGTAMSNNRLGMLLSKQLPVPGGTSVPSSTDGGTEAGPAVQPLRASASSLSPFATSMATRGIPRRLRDIMSVDTKATGLDHPQSQATGQGRGSGEQPVPVDMDLSRGGSSDGMLGTKLWQVGSATHRISNAGVSDSGTQPSVLSTSGYAALGSSSASNSAVGSNSSTNSTPSPLSPDTPVAKATTGILLPSALTPAATPLTTRGRPSTSQVVPVPPACPEPPLPASSHPLATTSHQAGLRSSGSGVPGSPVLLGTSAPPFPVPPPSSHPPASRGTMSPVRRPLLQEGARISGTGNRPGTGVVAEGTAAVGAVTGGAEGGDPSSSRSSPQVSSPGVQAGHLSQFSPHAAGPSSNSSSGILGAGPGSNSSTGPVPAPSPDSRSIMASRRGLKPGMSASMPAFRRQTTVTHRPQGASGPLSGSSSSTPTAALSAPSAPQLQISVSSSHSTPAGAPGTVPSAGQHVMKRVVPVRTGISRTTSHMGSSPSRAGSAQQQPQAGRRALKGAAQAAVGGAVGSTAAAGPGSGTMRQSAVGAQSQLKGDGLQNKGKGSDGEVSEGGTDGQLPTASFLDFDFVFTTTAAAAAAARTPSQQPYSGSSFLLRDTQGSGAASSPSTSASLLASDGLPKFGSLASFGLRNPALAPPVYSAAASAVVAVAAEAKGTSSSSSTLLQKTPSFGRDYFSPYGNTPAAASSDNPDQHQRQHSAGFEGKLQLLDQKPESDGRDFKSPYLQSFKASTDGSGQAAVTST